MAVATCIKIKFAGLGEKTDALEVFYPDRLAGRILGMGVEQWLYNKLGCPKMDIKGDTASTVRQGNIPESHRAGITYILAIK